MILVVVRAGRQDSPGGFCFTQRTSWRPNVPIATNKYVCCSPKPLLGIFLRELVLAYVKTWQLQLIHMFELFDVGKRKRNQKKTMDNIKDNDQMKWNDNDNNTNHKKYSDKLTCEFITCDFFWLFSIQNTNIYSKSHLMTPQEILSENSMLLV